MAWRIGHAEYGCDAGVAVAEYLCPVLLGRIVTGPTGNKFSGQIDWVQIDIGDDSQDHLIKPEDRLTVGMARQ